MYTKYIFIILGLVIVFRTQHLPAGRNKTEQGCFLSLPGPGGFNLSEVRLHKVGFKGVLIIETVPNPPPHKSRRSSVVFLSFLICLAKLNLSGV